MSPRPVFHFSPPKGWMNDPCGPGYDPTTGTYHLFFQWNPKQFEWGNVAWGHATSKDLVHWQYASHDTPALSPDQRYDDKGVFTGCFLPRGVHGETDQLSVVYSSVCYLPVEWFLPYIRGCAGLSMATSSDGGQSWHKLADNPIVREEPPNASVTGFRDPFVAAWAPIDKARGLTEGTGKNLYATVSGGIKGVGPMLFLYAIAADDLTKWTYLGPLINTPINLRPSAKWSGDYGTNWECAGFMTLGSEDEAGQGQRDFVLVGTQGGDERDWVKAYLADKATTFPRRVTRYNNWASGTVKTGTSPDGQDGGRAVAFARDADGILDHGCYYAASTFVDPVGPRSRRIVWGWLPEEDVTVSFCAAKGWNGCMALPRELFLQRIPHVTGALRSALGDIRCIHADREDDGTYTVETLGFRPLPELAALRTGEPHVLQDMALPAPAAAASHSRDRHLCPLSGRTWEIEATVDLAPGCTEVGFVVNHDEAMTTQTVVKFVVDAEEIVVVRAQSNASADINKVDDRGPFTLFKTRQKTGEQLEPLRLRLFGDHDVLEVYANERFALATMVYTRAAEADLISMFAHGSPGSAVFRQVKLWKVAGQVLGDV